MTQHETQCPNCGAPLQVAPGGITTCAYCGSRIEAPPAPMPPPQSPFGAPQPMQMPPPQSPFGAPQPMQMPPPQAQFGPPQRMQMPPPQFVPGPAMTPTGPNKVAILVPIAIAFVALIGGVVPFLMMSGRSSRTGAFGSSLGSGGPAGPPQPIALGETKVGNLSGPAITHQDYVLDVAKACRVRFDMVGQGIDSHIDLMTAGDAVIATDDDGGRGLDSRLEQVLQPGRYTVRAKLHSSHGSGSYTLAVTPLGLGSGLARPLTVPDAVSTVLGPPSSRTLGPTGAFFDEYAFPVRAGQSVHVALRCEGCHVVMVIEDQMGNPVAGDPTTAQYQSIDAVVASMTPGTYVARISSRESSPWTGQYLLMVSDGAAFAGGGTTTTLAPRLVIQGNLERGRRGRSAEYPLQVPVAAASAPGMYTVYFDANGDYRFASRVRLAVLDGSGATVAEGQRLRTSLVASALLTPGQPYRVRLTGRGRNATGIYTLAVARPIP